MVLCPRSTAKINLVTKISSLALDQDREFRKIPQDSRILTQNGHKGGGGQNGQEGYTMKFTAFGPTDRVLVKGDQLTNFRGESGYTYLGTTHPRKVTVCTPGDSIREFYASVFDCGIWCDTYAEWTFEPEWPHEPNAHQPLKTDTADDGDDYAGNASYEADPYIRPLD